MHGGKAANLERLQKLGFRVPEFVVAGGAAGFSPPAVPDAGGLKPAAPQETFYAVRSSAIGEDAAGLSFAGIHESLLFVKPGELPEAVDRVRASATSERANAYRAQHGLPPPDGPMPVIVQRMIDARVSGVAFTANPTTGDVHEVVISALFGLGEGLVSEGFDADTFVVQKAGLSIAAELAEKTERIVFDRDRGWGTKREPIHETGPSLTGDQIREVARAAIAIENAFGRPQDIEFAFDETGLYILQARPVTTAGEYGPAAGNRILWDNSNIVESFSGVTSPMTFSVIRRAYAIVYRQFAEVMGIPPGVVRAHQPVFENMLGLFRGQVFYNLLNWYALVRLFPGYEQNRAFMEQMMGVRESLGSPGSSGAKPEEPEELRGTPRNSRLALAPVAWRMLRHFSRIDTHVAEFESNFREHYARWSRIDYDALKPHELMALYLEFEERVLWSWRAPIINDFFVMIFYGVLKKLTADANDLLSGEGGIESAEPARMLLRLADMARPDAALSEAINAGDLGRIYRDHPRFARELDRYLDLYGFRCMNELKLEEQSLRDRPEFLLIFVRNYLATEFKPIDETRIRAEAERKVFGAMRSPLRRALLRFVLKRARIGVRNRENMRFARTRIFGLVREVVRAFGRRLHEEGLLDSPSDVFYLGLDELWDYVKGTALTTDLRGLAALRRAEFERYRAEPSIDERFETYGMAYHRNLFRARRAAVAAAEGLRGTPCSPGRVTGAVKVLRSPHDDLRLSGEILVAERTDPGWVPLYPSISGLLIERGSILSHSAIVAREMGIPTVVGIRGLTSLVKTGEVVTMDGSTGAVELHGDTTPAA